MARHIDFDFNERLGLIGKFKSVNNEKRSKVFARQRLGYDRIGLSLSIICQWHWESWGSQFVQRQFPYNVGKGGS